jgi:trans-aconitate methyltransferase
MKGIYLDAFGIPDVRTQLTAAYALRELADLSFSRMLDIGCGTGLVTSLIASRHPQAKIEGIDRDPSALTFANRLADQNHLTNVTYQNIDIESNAITGQFDIITAFAVMQFIVDIHRFLKSVYVLLDPGGYLLLQLPITDGDSIQCTAPVPSESFYPDFHEVRGPFTTEEA